MAVPKTIRKGSTGAEVTLLQQKLALPLAQFGTFDSFTEERVKAYQRAKGLTQDGIVGPKTWTALGVTNYTAPGSTANSGSNPFQYFPQIDYGGGGSSGGATAPGIAAGSRVKLTGNALTVLGTRALVVVQSALDKVSQELSSRGYTDITANSSYSEVTFEATLTMGKPTTATMAADLTAAGNAAGIPIGNARAEVTGAPGSYNPNKPNPKEDNTLLYVGGGLLALVVVGKLLNR